MAVQPSIRGGVAGQKDAVAEHELAKAAFEGHHLQEIWHDLALFVVQVEVAQVLACEW